MSNFNDLIKRAAHPGAALTPDDIAELRRTAEHYPASSVAPALLLKFANDALTDDERAEYQSRVALSGSDPTALVRFIDPNGQGFTAFYPPAPEQESPSTASAIDTFLDTYGHRSAEEDALLERMIFNPVPDYSEELARQEQESGEAPAPADDHQSSLIDAFLAANPPTAEEEVHEKPRPERRATHAAPPANPSDSLLSESLAKIFIKQGRYERAFEIISNLSLNYPKKSVYFADQLRFLQKLIINQQHLQADANKTKE
jgi:hypothetical protein